jgi:hypothetical protein
MHREAGVWGWWLGLIRAGFGLQGTPLPDAFLEDFKMLRVAIAA